MIPACPRCGCHRFTVGRNVTIWQTLDITMTDTQGTYEEQDEELHDINDRDPFTYAGCDGCGAEIDPDTLFA